MRRMQPKGGNFKGILLFVVIINFFLYFAYQVYSQGTDVDVFAVADSSDTYNGLMWIGAVIALAGCVTTGLSIKKKNSFLRGINIGVLIGVVIIAIAGSIIS